MSGSSICNLLGQDSSSPIYLATCLVPRCGTMSEASFSVVEPVEIEEVDRNPLEQFLVKMEHDLGGLGPQVRGPKGENLIIETVKTGKFNFDFISQQVEET